MKDHHHQMSNDTIAIRKFNSQIRTRDERIASLTARIAEMEVNKHVAGK